VGPALGRLGFRTLRRVLKVAELVEKSSPPRREVKTELGRFWEHSLWVALAAAHAAEILHEDDPADFYVAGLLHEIGRLVNLQHVPKADDPAALGACFARLWGLPAGVVEAAQRHRDPLEALHANPPGDMARIVTALCALNGRRATADAVTAVTGLKSDELALIQSEATKRSIVSLSEMKG
jgi:HD-like signal output (HDOD) protein